MMLCPVWLHCRANLKSASCVVLLPSLEASDTVDGETLDSETIFSCELQRRQQWTCGSLPPSSPCVCGLEPDLVMEEYLGIRSAMQTEKKSVRRPFIVANLCMSTK